MSDRINVSQFNLKENTMGIRAIGSSSYPRLVAGAWKFRNVEKDPDYGVSEEDLAETAIDMVNAGIGKGTFKRVFVRGTGPDEIGLCFEYEATDAEVETKESRDALKAAYIDFFKRRHGNGYKGYDYATGIEVITLIDD
jgi:hypothetical protein